MSARNATFRVRARRMTDLSPDPGLKEARVDLPRPSPGHTVVVEGVPGFLYRIYDSDGVEVASCAPDEEARVAVGWRWSWRQFRRVQRWSVVRITPRALMGHIWRRRFAWRPVRLWRVSPGPEGYVEPTDRRVWLRYVIEINTVWKDWVAYANHQRHAERAR